MIGYVWFIMWEYFVGKHPHCITLVFGLILCAFI